MTAAVKSDEPSQRGLVAGYCTTRRDEVHDEAVGADGKLRPAWEQMLGWLDQLGPEGYGRLMVENERLRTESGVAFSVDIDPARADATDVLPVVIGPDDWAAIDAAVCQRARLTEAVLRDIYGPRRMMSKGLLPPAIVYANPTFAPYCAGWDQPPDPWLYLYEADIARGADGRWMVLADRVNAPLGDGWMIANRVAASQAFAEPFIDLGVRRLAAHYAEFQDEIELAAGPGGRIALLTAGERDPRYFSHAYLARYLGAALIEPRDITVREGNAYVKTIDGLKPLDVLLRGVHDRRLEALFRPGEAAPGAPSLSMAARSGGLRIANALGASAMAYRALAPFAHGLAPALLGEELLMSDGPCLWLGDPEAREQLLEEPEFWRIENLGSGPAPDLPRLVEDGADRDAALRRIRREGARLAAVATPPLSTVPVWRAGRLAPRQWMLRVFACLTPSGWRTAPGGIASVVEPGRAPPPIGFGKDIWVLPDADRTEDVASVRTGVGFDPERRTSRELLSRIADDIFWVGRNAERIETTLRVLRCCLTRLLSGIGIDGAPETLTQIVETQAGRGFDTDPRARLRDALQRLISGPEESLGMRPLLEQLQQVGRNAQPYLSEDGWRCIDRLTSDPRWRDPPDPRRASTLLRLIDDGLMALSAFAGTAHENQTRNNAWRFLELGRRIERGLSITRLAEAMAGAAHPGEQTLLRAWHVIGDSRTAYRTRYMTVAAAEPTIELMLLDEDNPRSLVYQLVELEAALGALPRSGLARRPEHRFAMRALMNLRLAEVPVLAEEDGSGMRAALLELMGETRAALLDISEYLARAFFAHTERTVAIVRPTSRYVGRGP